MFVFGILGLSCKLFPYVSIFFRVCLIPRTLPGWKLMQTFILKPADSCSAVGSSSSGLGVSEDFLQSIIADVKSVAWYVLGLVVVFVVDVFVG